MVYRAIALTISGLAFAASAGAQSYKIPAESAALLAGVDLAGATPFEDYRQQFDRCDGTAPGGVGKDRFRGHPLPATRRCSTDPNRVRALMRLADGGIYWDSKMALDVDGSHVATSGTQWTYRNGRPRSTTDQCGTSLKWSAVPGGNDCQHPQAHVDPDIFPYIAIPGGGAGYLPAAERQKISGEFRRTTGLSNGDMGIVVYRDRWTPAFIADAGPFYRLGEGSAKVLAAVDSSRCIRGSNAQGQCVGDATKIYPYSDRGLPGGVIFLFYPGSGAGLTKAEALRRICTFAREKLKLTGSTTCPAT